jgi:hypothetical protein
MAAKQLDRSHRVTMRLIRHTGFAAWYGVLNFCALVLSAGAIVAASVMGRQLGPPTWGYVVILDATLFLAGYRIVHSLRIERDESLLERVLAEAASRRPRDDPEAVEHRAAIVRTVLSLGDPSGKDALQMGRSA